jgi:hypothetical protein
MSNLSIYIVCHNEKAFKTFKSLGNEEYIDKCNYILVGIDKYDKFKGMDNLNTIIPIHLPYNIEQHISLLTFTAWYALVKNDLVKTDFVGIFEYDVQFTRNPFPLEFDKNSIYGASYRDIPDYMFLETVPYLKRLLTPRETETADRMRFWMPSSNMIMPEKFLVDFVEYYTDLIPKIMDSKCHSHFHERMINLFAVMEGYKLEPCDIIHHKQYNSHGLNLVME